MLCPHCGKEIENSFTITMPANVNANNGCNPVLNTFVPLADNAGNPITWIPFSSVCAAPAAAANPQVLTIRL